MSFACFKKKSSFSLSTSFFLIYYSVKTHVWSWKKFGTKLAVYCTRLLRLPNLNHKTTRRVWYSQENKTHARQGWEQWWIQSKPSPHRYVRVPGEQKTLDVCGLQFIFLGSDILTYSNSKKAYSLKSRCCLQLFSRHTLLQFHLEMSKR